jgi:hypothetical protein
MLHAQKAGALDMHAARVNTSGVDHEQRQIKARLAEIDRRYRRKRKGRRASIESLRVRELQRLFAARHGEQLPDDQAGRIAAEAMAHHIAALPGDPRRRIASWLRDHAPWLSIGDADDLLTAAITRPKRWKADALGWRLKLIAIDRTALKITTIGACDVSKAERAKRRRERKRQLEQARRKANGATSRAQYLAQHATSQARPWIAAGISRRTWYRRRNRSPGTGGTGP